MPRLRRNPRDSSNCEAVVCTRDLSDPVTGAWSSTFKSLHDSRAMFYLVVVVFRHIVQKSTSRSALALAGDVGAGLKLYWAIAKDSQPNQFSILYEGKTPFAEA